MPETVQSLLPRAVADQQAGRLAEAEQAYRQILEQSPRHPDAMHLLGVLKIQQQNFDEAVPWIERAIAAKGSAWSFHSNLAYAFQELGRLDEAIASYHRAIHLEPHSAALYSNLATACQQQGNHDQAAAWFAKAIEIDPKHADAHYNLGNLNREQGHVDKAMACYEQAIRLRPDYSEAHANLANLLLDQGQLDEAARSYRWAIEINPRNVEAQYNLGRALKALGQFDEALAAYRTTLKLRPDYAEAHNALGLLLLRLGQLEQGWEEYEWRWRKTDATPLRELPYPLWQGQPLKDKSLLVYSEQGIGDEIMFGSCLPDIIQRAGKCVIECDRRLVSLFQRSFPEAIVHGRQGWNEHGWLATCPPIDFQVPTGNLPRYLRPSLASFPRRDRFLCVDETQRRRWAARLDELGDGWKVGICWRGHREDEIKQQRSTELRDWKPLLTTPGFQLISLQYGPCEEEIDRISRETSRTIHRWEDFDPSVEIDSLAALMSSLDLIITVGNTTAHLAGALGLNVWTLLSAQPSWRWMQHRLDSPWYRSMRIFRQQQPGEWAELFDRVAHELHDRVRHGGSHALKLRASVPHQQPVERPAGDPQPLDDHEATTPEAEEVRLTDSRLGLENCTLEEAYQRAIDAHKKKDYSRAEGIYRELLRHRPGNFPTLHMMACLTRETGRPELAVQFARKAIAVEPNKALIHANLATAQIDLDELEEAEKNLANALRLDPDCAEAHINLGALYERQGILDRALKHCTRGIELAPQKSCAHYNMANVLFHLGRVDDCIASHRRVLEIEPSYIKARWNLGLAQLLDARFAEGWEGYQYREEAKQVDLDHYPQPCWDGSSLAGKTILVHAEQGVGDEIMFGSCLPDVIEKAGHLVLLCEPRLAPLFARSFPQATVHGVRRVIGHPWIPPQPIDLQIPLGSLPRLLRHAWDDFPRRPYLAPDADLTRIWRDRLESLGEGLKIGISWRAGGRANEQRRRTTLLENWEPLFKVPGVKWINLQYGECENDLAAARERGGTVIHDWPDADPKSDLDSFAAQVAALDFVISVGNTTVHMAGAMGVPTWSVLPKVPGWRWLLSHDTFPWYPDVWLYRQRDFQDWRELFERMAKLLEARLADGWLPTLVEDRRQQRFAALEARRAAAAGSSQASLVVSRGLPPTPASAAHATRHDRHEQDLVTAIRQHRLGDLAAAETIYQRILQEDPSNADALHLLGTLAHQQGHAERAIGLIQAALAKQPRAVAHYNLANALRDTGRIDEAIGHYRQAITLDPHLAEAHLNVGILLKDQGRLEEAKESFKRALLARPDLVEAHTNMGLLHIEQHAPVKALKSFERAAELQPNQARTQMHVAGVLRQLGKSEEALERYARAIELDPNDAEVRVQRAMLLLQLGRFAEGWREWEWRWLSRQSPRHRNFPQPVWDGSPLKGKRIIVHGEQGIGDEIMFASCLGEVVAAAEHCLIECEPRLAGLFRRSLPQASVHARQSWDDSKWLEAYTPFDYQIPAGSLPGILRSRRTDFPARPSFLLADQDLRAAWRERLDRWSPGLKVGISWNARSHPEEPPRNAPLTHWHPLWRIGGIQCVNLQYGDCQAELDEVQRQWGVRIANWDDLDVGRDLESLAALIAELDLIITVGNTTAHLAGALGAEVWTLVSSAPSWRWLLGHGDNPWYPTMRVCQQTTHAWQDVFGQLETMVEQRSQQAGRAAKRTVPTPHSFSAQRRASRK